MHKFFLIIFMSLFLPSLTYAGLEDGLRAYQKNDFSTAFEEFHKVAEQGDVTAQNVLGFMYAYGQGVAKDGQQAITWYRKAADQGFPEAQAGLARVYEAGLGGVAINKQQAVYWYLKAADQGVASAQYNLGFMHANGYGVMKDEQLAADWYRKAADQGFAPAQYNLGIMYANGQGVAKNEQLATDWYRKASAQGHTGARTALNMMQIK